MADATEVQSAAGGAVSLDPAAVAAAKKEGLKIPADLSKVSNAKAKELVDAGLVEDQDLPGKMYRRHADGFVARIPNYTFEAYDPTQQARWGEIKLTSEPS